jgi:hypothetical protein
MVASQVPEKAGSVIVSLRAGRALETASRHSGMGLESESQNLSRFVIKQPSCTKTKKLIR